MVKSSESPGSTKPTSSPVSAKTMPASIAYPSQPDTTVGEQLNQTLRSSERPQEIQQGMKHAEERLAADIARSAA